MTGNRVFNLIKVAGGDPKGGRARLGYVKCRNVHLGNQRVPKSGLRFLQERRAGMGTCLQKVTLKQQREIVTFCIFERK